MDARSIGHHHVEHRDVEVLAGERRSGVRAARDRLHPVPGEREVRRNEAPGLGVIVGDEEPHRSSVPRFLNGG